MPYLTNLRNLLKERGKSEELSKNTGISSGNISDWKSGRSKPGVESLLKIADYFDCSVDYLLDRTDERTILKRNSDIVNRSIDMGDIIYIDTYSQPVSAGKGNIYIDDFATPHLYPNTPISSKADYCVRISGDSMYPEFLDGDIVYVDNKTKDLNNGDIGIFLYDGEAYCKEYYKKDGTKKMISLNPDQEKYTPIVIENDSFEARGKVIGKFHAD